MTRERKQEQKLALLCRAGAAGAEQMLPEDKPREGWPLMC